MEIRQLMVVSLDDALWVRVSTGPGRARQLTAELRLNHNEELAGLWPARNLHMAASNHRILQTPVLVLNATYEPINVTAVRRAIVLVMKGVATTEEENGAYVHSARLSLRIPSVIRLTQFRRIPYQTRALSRKNILMRDRNTCQFCGRAFPASELTLDHVIPRSRGGHTDWDNLVACCHDCNNRKGDRLPEEAGLKLLRSPRPFTLHTSRQLMRMVGSSDERWRKYLFY